MTEEKEPAKPENADDAEDDDAPTNKQLPPLKVNEPVKALKITPQQHFTKPPLPYSEALLVKALEQHGVGRPSTYAQTVGTIKKRGYVEVQKRRLFPTELGREVHAVLSSKLPGLFEVPFTAAMESALDEIAAGQRESKAYLKAFWQQVSPQFGETVIQAVVAARSGTKATRSSCTPPAQKRRATSRAAAKTTRRSARQGRKAALRRRRFGIGCLSSVWQAAGQADGQARRVHRMQRLPEVPLYQKPPVARANKWAPPLLLHARFGICDVGGDGIGWMQRSHDRSFQ